VLKKPLPCLLAARDGAKPSIFCMFCENKQKCFSNFIY